eukprot:COSAG04_NODE_764_length_10501_cov_25.377812_1_plen_279_part_00
MPGFLEATKPDLLKNFKVAGSSVSGIMDVLRVGFGCALIFSYPIVVWEARHMLIQELLRKKYEPVAKDETDEEKASVYKAPEAEPQAEAEPEPEAAAEPEAAQPADAEGAEQVAFSPGPDVPEAGPSDEEEHEESSTLEHVRKPELRNMKDDSRLKSEKGLLCLAGVAERGDRGRDDFHRRECPDSPRAARPDRRHLLPAHRLHPPRQCVPPPPRIFHARADVCDAAISLVIFLGDPQTVGQKKKRKIARAMKWMGFGLIPLCTFITLWGMLTESHSE